MSWCTIIDFFCNEYCFHTPVLIHPLLRCRHNPLAGRSITLRDRAVKLVRPERNQKGTAHIQWSALWWTKRQKFQRCRPDSQPAGQDCRRKIWCECVGLVIVWAILGLVCMELLHGYLFLRTTEVDMFLLPVRTELWDLLPKPRSIDHRKKLKIPIN